MRLLALATIVPFLAALSRAQYYQVIPENQCAQSCFDRVCPYAGRNYNALLVCTCYEKRGPFNECVQGCDREFDRFITSLEVAEFCEQR